MSYKKKVLLATALLAFSLAGNLPPAPPAEAVTLSTLRVSFSRVASGLSSPVAIAAPNDGTGRLFIAEQAGRVRVRSGGGTVLAGAYLDIRSKVLDGGERGLLGIAFSPGFKTNRYFFVAYTNGSGALVVSRFRASTYTANSVAASTETVFLTVAHPDHGNHNGGQLAFGPDGYLYVGTGDGGGAGDPDDNAHDVTKLLGKILRIDVNRACNNKQYCIPATNPYAASTGADEVWQYGLRNPWRFSFDRSNGTLWIADVGQGSIEEIDRIGAGIGGKNFGWDCWEGTSRYSNESYCTPLSSTIRPVTQYGHGSGDCAVIGGFVYRGSRYRANMGGVYLYGDYCTGYVRAYLNGSTRLVLNHTGSITSFGEDVAGELYAVDAEGGLYRVVASGGVTPKPASPKPAPTPTPTKASPTPSRSPSVSPSPTPSPTPSESPTPTETAIAAPDDGDGGSSPWPWVLTGIGAAGVGALVGVRVLRRR